MRSLRARHPVEQAVGTVDLKVAPDLVELHLESYLTYADTNAYYNASLTSRPLRSAA